MKNKVLVYSDELKCKVLVEVSAIIATEDRENNPYLALVTTDGEGFVATYSEVELIKADA